MSLFGAMNAGVSGFASQSSAMAAITNVNTVGYRGTKVDFQTLSPGRRRTRCTPPAEYNRGRAPASMFRDCCRRRRRVCSATRQSLLKNPSLTVSKQGASRDHLQRGRTSEVVRGRQDAV